VAFLPGNVDKLNTNVNKRKERKVFRYTYPEAKTTFYSTLQKTKKETILKSTFLIARFIAYLLQYFFLCIVKAREINTESDRAIKHYSRQEIKAKRR
jgi:hypothetical protein